MKCPKCPGEMKVSKFAGMEIDRCTACHGIWFNTGEFDKLVKDDWLAEYIDKGPTKIDTRHIREADCPECGTHMGQEADQNQPHIVYERCPKGHGVFFDAGEFKDLTKQTFWDKFKLSDDALG